MTSHEEDFTELERAAQGDAEAFTRIYNRYRARVYGFAYRMVGDAPTAEDVTHETFLVIIRQPERYRAEQGSLLTFLCAIARNHILKYFRRKGYEVDESFDGQELMGRKLESETNQLSLLLEQELAAKVNKSIARLPLLQREAFVLREFQELSHEEISAVVGVDVNAVKARLHRARRALAKSLSPYMKLKGVGYELRKS